LAGAVLLAILKRQKAQEFARYRVFAMVIPPIEPGFPCPDIADIEKGTYGLIDLH
jgi:hypothetical protein